MLNKLGNLLAEYHVIHTDITASSYLDSLCLAARVTGSRAREDKRGR